MSLNFVDEGRILRGDQATRAPASPDCRAIAKSIATLWCIFFVLRKSMTRTDYGAAIVY
jgi:hypothetical protein